MDRVSEPAEFGNGSGHGYNYKKLRLQIFKKELAPALLNFKNWLRLQGFFKTSPAKAAAKCYDKL